MSQTCIILHIHIGQFNRFVSFENSQGLEFTDSTDSKVDIQHREVRNTHCKC